MLDANPARHDPTWFGATATRAAFRLPGMSTRYTELEKLFRDAQEGNFEAYFLNAAAAVARPLKNSFDRPFEQTFSKAALTNALQGRPQRLDKAVVAALTINRIAEDLKAPPEEPLSSYLAGQPPGAQVTIRVPWHGIAACIYYFHRFEQLFEIAKTYFKHACKSDDVSARSILARSCGQPIDLIEGMLHGVGAGGAPLEQGARRSNGVTVCYRTARSLFRALQRVPQLEAQLVEDETVRIDYVRQQRKSDPRRIALPQENIDWTWRISRPPYNWDVALPDEVAEPDDPFPLKDDGAWPADVVERIERNSENPGA
ncbi:MAG: hypothetical protein MRY74_00075 [Neomegalonema sp.]|nr:hypothetical protein [Neomegalonema sp.]